MKNCLYTCLVVAAVALAGARPAAANEVPALEKWAKYTGSTNNVANNRCTIITYAKPDRRPIWFGAESACEGVSDGEYCLYLDLIEEGAPEWGVKALFSSGTHGWEKAERVIVPARPVKEIRCYLFLRHATGGTARFRAPFLVRGMPPAGHVLAATRRTMRPFAVADQVDRTLSNGKKIVKDVVREPSTFTPANPLAADEVAVWPADSMRRVSPLAFPTAAEKAVRTIDLDLARGERESFQLCLSTGDRAEAKGVTLAVSPLLTEQGERFAGSVDCRRIGYLARRPGYHPHPFAPPEHELWFAEPLLPLAPVEVSPASTRGLWVTVHADRAAKPGLYRARATLAFADRPTVTLALAVRVRSFALPEQFGLKTAYCVMDGFTRDTYPDQFKVRKRESWDIMLDHRLNPDDISRTTPPDIDDLLYARSRGMNSFNALHLVPPPTDPRQRWVCFASPEAIFTPAMRTYLERTLGPYVKQLRQHGLDRLAYVYGFDERGTEYYPKMFDFCREIREKYGLPVLTTAYMFRDVTWGKLAESSPYATMTECHCPPLANYDLAMADRFRAKGKKVWTYTCCGPRYPTMNCSSYEYPLVECRLLGWLVRLLRTDGFLFWHVNYWPRGAKIDERETFFPAWDSYSGLGMPGDGIFIYPGREHILPGIRLANVRDGVEDWDWLQMAEAKVGRAKVEALIRRIVRERNDFSRDPASVRSVRSALADLIEKGN